MLIDKFMVTQSVIVSLDVDNLLAERIEQTKNAGFTAIEINSTDPEMLSRVVKQNPGLHIGASGIINTQQLENCYHAGVHFASSPGFLPAIAQTANVYSMNYLPGIATLSEAMAALSLGIHQIRPLPASLAFCTLLNKYLPSLNLFPIEVEWEEAEHFLNLPAVVAVSIHNPDKKQLMALSTTVFA
ncbi:multidrug DMT transporter permease [uncultured Legionella sp.]|uniref:multidrug DMT transporter permease n=1 Tax=uncultured Legionella sp. TaxID=210934 RepID=UPI0026366FF3|nr:multidrug DMT transporter permease [uncultured Legionella sp.]